MPNIRVSILTTIIAVVIATIAIAGFLWLQTADTSAQEIVESSCAQAEAIESHDLTGPVVGYENGVKVIDGMLELRTSGDDFHSITTSSNSDEFAELIQVDGTVYYRDNLSPWRVMSITNIQHSFPYSLDSLCPDLGPVARVGEETIDSIPVTHFESSKITNYGILGNVDDVSSPSELVVTDEWDIWIDDTGQMVQFTHTVSSPKTHNSPDESSEVTLKISGVGEPNIITAPEVS